MRRHAAFAPSLSPLTAALRMALAAPAVFCAADAAAAIVVTDTGAPSASTCTLAQAINAANAANGISAAAVGSSTPPGNCSGAVSGFNSITFSGWPTITLNGIDNYWYGPNALPPIVSTMSIGNYPGTGATLVAAHAGDPTPTTAQAFRLFYVSGGFAGELPAGTLLMSGMTLKGGYAKGGDAGLGGGGAGMGGAIFNQGALGLYGVSLIGNVAQGGSSGQGTKLGGGGLGQDATDSGGGFGGPLGGTFGGAGGGEAFCRGGGGGGFISGSNGAAGGNGYYTSYGGAGGGKGRLGGVDSYVYHGEEGDGDGGDGGGYNRGNYCNFAGLPGAGGRFGNGGSVGGEYIPPADGYDGYTIGSGGGGGVGGGGGGGRYFQKGGSGGFGGGGASWGGRGGFGAGGDGGAGFGASNGGAGMGGAIFNHRGSVRLLNVTAYGNAARGGAGNGSGLGAVLFNLNGIATVEFSTLAGNSLSGNNGPNENAGESNGTIYSLAYGNKIEDGSASSATLRLSKSIVIATHGVTGARSDDIAVNVIDGDQANASNLLFLAPNLAGHVRSAAKVVQSGNSPGNSDPLLGPPRIESGVPHPFLVLPIGASSPARNAVDCAESDATTNHDDGRGVARPLSGCDIGAYEFDGDYVFSSDFNAPLRNAHQDYDPAHCAAVASTLDIYWQEVDSVDPTCNGIEHTDGSLVDAADGSFSMNGVSVTNACISPAKYSFTLSPDKYRLIGSDTTSNVPMTLTLGSDGACFVGHWTSGQYDFTATIWKFATP